MDDALKLLTAHLARQKTANGTSGPRALNSAKRWSYSALDDQAGPNLEYWVGLLPADTSKYDDFRKTIVTENIIGPALNRFVAGMLGRDWEWSLKPPEADPLDVEDERVAALSAWHKDADAWGAMKDLAFGVMALGRGSLRVYIPAVYGTDESPVTAGSVATYPEALELIHVMFVPATADPEKGEGGAIRDEYGREVAYYYLYSVPTEDNKTETRLELHTPEEVGLFKVDGDKYEAIGSPVPNPFYDPAIKRRPRFLMREASRDGGSVVTQTAVDLQNDYNVVLSNRRKNSDVGGHRQYVTIDAQDPTDDQGNPVPYSFGPRVVAAIKSLFADMNGQPLPSPTKASVQVFDPVPVAIFNDHAEATKKALLGYYDQLWTVIGEANISGESRRESRASYEKRVALEAEPVIRTAGWLIETVGMMAAWLVGKPQDMEGFTASARFFLDSQPTDLTTYQALLSAYNAGALDLETLADATPVSSDAGMLMERIVGSRASNPGLLNTSRAAGLPEADYLIGMKAAGLKISPESITQAQEMASLTPDTEPPPGAAAEGGADGEPAAV